MAIREAGFTPARWHPAEPAALVMALLYPGAWNDDGGAPGEGTPGEGTVLNAEQIRVDQRRRDIQFLRAEAVRDDNPLLPARALNAVADMLTAAPNDPAPIL